MKYNRNRSPQSNDLKKLFFLALAKYIVCAFFHFPFILLKCINFHYVQIYDTNWRGSRFSEKPKISLKWEKCNKLDYTLIMRKNIDYDDTSGMLRRKNAKTSSLFSKKIEKWFLNMKRIEWFDAKVCEYPHGDNSWNLSFQLKMELKNSLRHVKTVQSVDKRSIFDKLSAFYSFYIYASTYCQRLIYFNNTIWTFLFRE